MRRAINNAGAQHVVPFPVIKPSYLQGEGIMDVDQQAIIWEYRQADEYNRLNMYMRYRDLRRTFIGIDRDQESRFCSCQKTSVWGPAIFREMFKRWVLSI